MKRNVLITNHSSSLNLGDAALLSSTILMIRKILGDKTSISILTSDHHNIPQDENITTFLDPLLLPIYLKTYGNKDGINSLSDLFPIQPFHDCDAVIVRGGDALSSVYGNLSLLFRVMESSPNIIFQKPIVFLGHTFAPLLGEGPVHSLALRLLKKELKMASFITVREEQSLTQLIQLGIDKEKIIIAPDVAFLLQPSKKRVAKDILSKVLRGGSSSVIGVTNSYSLYHFFSRSGVKNEYGRFVARFLDQIVTDFGIEIVLLPHSFIPGKDDRFINEEIYRHSTKRELIHPIREVLSPELAKALIGCFDMLISFGRLHPIIHAVAQGVPCMGIDYSFRMDGFFRSINMKDYSRRLHSLDYAQLLDDFKRIWSERDDVSFHLQEEMKLINNKLAKVNELLRTFLLKEKLPWIKSTI